MARLFVPEVTQTGDTIRIAWDMRRPPRNLGRLVLILLAGPFLAVVGSVPAFLAFADSSWAMPDPPWGLRAFAVVWGAIFWLFAGFAGYDLRARRWLEWVEVSLREITVGRRGLLSPRAMTIPVETGTELFFGVYNDDPDRREAAIQLQGLASLEVVRRHPFWGCGSRTEFGRWLPGWAKEQVFQLLADFIAARNLPITVTRGPP
jgi:hypothetical protein